MAGSWISLAGSNERDGIHTETILRSFETSLRKGAIGEEIVRPYLEAKGYVVCRPVSEGAHAFDGLAIYQKKHCIAYDVKAKARMNKWPATGVNESHFTTYWTFSQNHNMPFWLFFVDEILGQIYGNELAILEQQKRINGIDYPFLINTRTAKIRIWPLESMIKITDLTDEQKDALAACNQRTYTAPSTTSCVIQTLNIDGGHAWKSF